MKEKVNKMGKHSEVNKRSFVQKSEQGSVVEYNRIEEIGWKSKKDESFKSQKVELPRPYGFVRMIERKTGNIFEGFMDQEGRRQGFGRYIVKGRDYIGWFRDDQRHGNGQYINKDMSIFLEGYFNKNDPGNQRK